MKTKLPAVIIERSRVKLFTQWHFRAEFTAPVDRFIIAVVAEKVYNSTTVKIMISRLVRPNTESNVCFKAYVLMNAKLINRNRCTHWRRSLAALVPAQLYGIWCRLRKQYRCIFLSNGHTHTCRIPCNVCKTKDI